MKMTLIDGTVVESIKVENKIVKINGTTRGMTVKEFHSLGGIVHLFDPPRTEGYKCKGTVYFGGCPLPAREALKWKDVAPP